MTKACPRDKLQPEELSLIHRPTPVNRILCVRRNALEGPYSEDKLKKNVSIMEGKIELFIRNLQILIETMITTEGFTIFRHGER